ncbi:MAG: tetratricopeptide repeat protein [Nitrospirae bacterium]|nr:tetratricopeptide repeat protein [Nitrospirota bacterium]
MLGIILFTKAVGTEGKKKVIYTLAIFIISLMGMASREEFFIFPIILILYDLYFISKQDIKGALKNYKIHLPVILTLAYVIYIVTSHDYGEHAGYGVKTITPLEYLITQFNAHWTYIRLLILPINQNLDYDYSIARSLFEFPTIISLIGYVGLWGTGIYLYRRNPVISFCIIWFMVTLFPSSSVMPLTDVFFEHRLYMPIMGTILAFTLSIVYVLQFIVHRSHVFSSHFSLPTYYFLLLSAIVVVFSIVTYQRNIVWQDEVSLWEDVTKKSPEKVRGYYNLGKIYSDKGWSDKAIKNYQIALRVKPDYIEAHTSLGLEYNNIVWIDKAIEHYQIAISLGPDFQIAHNNIGNAYLAKGWIDKAIEHYQIALRLKPDFAEAHNNLGRAYETNGLLDNAAEEYRAPLRFSPGNDVVQSNLNRIFQLQNKKN